MNNVQAQMIHNYDIVGNEYLAVSTPYDYLSIMQYGIDSFGKVINVCQTEFWSAESGQSELY